MTSSFTLFFAEALTLLALISSIRGWWPAIFLGFIHFLCLSLPWVHRVTKTYNNKLPLLAAECQLVYAVSVELKARRSSDESSQATMAFIRAGMVSAAFWILVFFCSEMAVATANERDEQHFELVPENLSVPRTKTSMYSPVSSSSPTYQWIFPAPSSSTQSTTESTPERGRVASFSAVCTVQLETTSNPGARPHDSCRDDRSNCSGVAPPFVSPVSRDIADEDRRHVLETFDSPQSFHLDHLMPSFSATTDAPSVTASNVESHSQAPADTIAATNTAVGFPTRLASLELLTDHESAKPPPAIDTNQLEAKEQTRAEKDSVAQNVSRTVTPDRPCTIKKQASVAAASTSLSCDSGSADTCESPCVTAMAGDLNSLTCAAPLLLPVDCSTQAENEMHFTGFETKSSVKSWLKRRFISSIQEHVAKRLKCENAGTSGTTLKGEKARLAPTTPCHDTYME